MRWRLLAGRAVGLLLLGHGTTINFEAPALRGSNRGPVGPGPREGPWDRNLTQESNAHHISAFRVGDAVADRGYYEGEEIKSCEEAGITVTLPKPQTSSAKAEGRFGKQDFERQSGRALRQAGLRLCCSRGCLSLSRRRAADLSFCRRRRWQELCVESAVTTGPERRISRWEHEAVLEKVQSRLDRNPAAMTVRRQTAEHPFGTVKCWMGATHFLMRRLGKVSTEMALNVLAYNIKRVIAIVGVGALLEAMTI